MKVFETLRDFIGGFDRRDLIRYSSLYIGVCVTIIVLLLIRHFYLVSDAQEKIQQVNQARKSVQKILTKFTLVEQQKKKVDVLLKEKFYIEKFFEEHIKKLKINGSSKKSSENKENGYTEESLSITLTQATTQQLCDLLQVIEKEQRIYIKFVDITKAGNARKISVSMSIATLIPKS